MKLITTEIRNKLLANGATTALESSLSPARIQFGGVVLELHWRTNRGCSYHGYNLLGPATLALDGGSASDHPDRQVF
jgi:hypothetical protein